MNKNVFISSSCIKSQYIYESVEFLAKSGFEYIELSGGTNWYSNLLQDLLVLKKKYNLKFRCHNYFPPPKKHFVVNLSLPKAKCKESVDFLKNTIELNARLDSSLYAIHAGFRIIPDVTELGAAISKKIMLSNEDAVCFFRENWLILSEFADSQGVTLYLENNVLSHANYASYLGENPFLATESNSILSLIELCRAKFLLDVAHLKVSSTTIGLDFKKQFESLINYSDYLHISDNNGLEDQNLAIKSDSEMYRLLKTSDIHDKEITLEVYEDINKIRSTYDLIQDL